MLSRVWVRQTKLQSAAVHAADVYVSLKTITNKARSPFATPSPITETSPPLHGTSLAALAIHTMGPNSFQRQRPQARNPKNPLIFRSPKRSEHPNHPTCSNTQSPTEAMPGSELLLAELSSTPTIPSFFLAPRLIASSFWGWIVSST